MREDIKKTFKILLSLYLLYAVILLIIVGPPLLRSTFGHPLHQSLGGKAILMAIYILYPGALTFFPENFFLSHAILFVILLILALILAFLTDKYNWNIKKIFRIRGKIISEDTKKQ